MGMPDTARRYTVDEVLAFPADGNRYELVDGELLVTPAPAVAHQQVVGQLSGLLYQYLERNEGHGKIFLSPADITWGGEQLVQPDLFVVIPSEVTSDWSSFQTLLLAVEVASPGSARYDRVTKRLLYQRQQVATYWVVDHDAQVVEVWRPDDRRPEIVTEVLRWRVAEDAPELEIPLASLFGDLPT
jgi:Uma2 family endonuclease